MTEPLNPNRVGGVRGLNGTTLDEVVAVLAQIRDRLEQSDTRLSNIETLLSQASLDLSTLNERVGILSGTEPLPGIFGAWPAGGLPYWLSRVFLTPDEVDFAGLSVGRSVLRTEAFLVEQINERLFKLNDEFGQLPTGEGGGALGFHIRRIADALRQQGELPEDSSIFRLLASIDTNVGDIKDCACDEEEDTSLRPPPNLCDPLPGGANQIRVQAWSRLNPGGPTGIWGAVWPPSSIPPFVSLVNDTSEIYDWPGLGAEGATLDVCFSWDFTLDNITGFTSSALGTLTNWGPGNPRTPTGAALPIGVASFVMPIGAVRGLIIQNDQPDVAPSLNAFLSIGVRPT